MAASADGPKVAEVRAWVRRERKARTIHANAVRTRNRLMLEAWEAGELSQAKLAELAGVSKQRMEQIVKAAREARAAEAERQARMEGIFDDVLEWHRKQDETLRN